MRCFKQDTLFSFSTANDSRQLELKRTHPAAAHHPPTSILTLDLHLNSQGGSKGAEEEEQGVGHGR